MDAVRNLNEPVEFAMEETGHYWFSLTINAFIIAEVLRIFAGKYSRTS